MNSRPSAEQPVPVVLARSPSFRIGGIEVRPATRQVIGPGSRETIEPRVMQVLVALHQAGGGIVSRDELIQSCWGGRVVGDDSINRAISKIRKIGETVGAGAFKVETVTKVGYRLAWSEGNDPAGEPLAVVGESESRRGMSRRLVLGGAAALAAAGGGGAFWMFRSGAAHAGTPEARRHFEHGKALLTKTGSDAAIAAFQRAVEADPNFAEAWGQLALSLELSRFFQAPASADLIDRRSREATQRALELDPSNAAAITAQALATPFFGDWLTAETRLRDALTSDPRQVVARDYLSRVLENVGRTREALELVETYGDLLGDLPHVQYRRAVMQWSAGRQADAERTIDQAMQRWPGAYSVWFTRYWLYVRTDRPNMALAMSKRLPRPPGTPDWNFELNDLNARAVLTKAPADVQRAVAENRKAAEQGAGFCENGIHLAAQLGLLDEAFALADAYYFGRGFRVAATRFSAQKQTYTPRYRRLTGLLFTPTSASMRSDPRFAPLMEEIGLASYWRRSGARADVLA